MWEFMANYAESFWEQRNSAFEVVTVIMTWVITLVEACFVIIVIVVIVQMICDKIKDRFTKGESKNDNDVQ